MKYTVVVECSPPPNEIVPNEVAETEYLSMCIHLYKTPEQKLITLAQLIDGYSFLLLNV